MAGESGEKPKSTSKAFDNAATGKEPEKAPVSPYTKQQHAAAERFIQAQKQPESRGKRGDIKSAEGRFDFAVATDPKAIEKAKSEQQAKEAAKPKRTTHHAPAPTPSYATPNPKRGVSMNKDQGQSQADKKAGQKSAELNKQSLAANIAAENAHKKEQSKGKGKGKGPDKDKGPDKGMGR